MQHPVVNYELWFSICSTAAMLGWLVLLFAPLVGNWTDRIAALAIPLLLSVAYTGVILANWSGAEGGFGSLAEVMQLFTHPGLVLAGWLHYLAFDLFVGAWQVRTARREGMSHWWVLPCLPLTLMFAPAGFLLFNALRMLAARRSATQQPNP